MKQEGDYPGHLWEATWENEDPERTSLTAVGTSSSSSTMACAGETCAQPSYRDLTIYMAQGWDEDVSLLLQEEELQEVAEQSPAPETLPVPTWLAGCLDNSGTSVNGSLGETAEVDVVSWGAPPQGDWLAVVGDRRHLRGQLSVFQKYVDEPGQSQFAASTSSSSWYSGAAPGVTTLPSSTSSSSSSSSTSMGVASSTSCWRSTSTLTASPELSPSSCSSTCVPTASSSTTPPSVDSQEGVSSSDLSACYRGDFSNEPGLTQRGQTIRRGRDRWHNLDGTTINRQRDRQATEEQSLPHRLATVPEEPTQPANHGVPATGEVICCPPYADIFFWRLETTLACSVF